MVDRYAVNQLVLYQPHTVCGRTKLSSALSMSERRVYFEIDYIDGSAVRLPN